MKDSIIFIFSVLGFINAWYLHYQYTRQQKRGKKMFCILGGDCGKVVSSRFGTTLGVKNEIIGILFYAFIGVSSIANIFLHSLLPFLILLTQICITLAFLFSLYLFVLQMIILRKLCSWCLIAIGINIIIFSVSVIAR